MKFSFVNIFKTVKVFTNLEGKTTVHSDMLVFYYRLKHVALRLCVQFNLLRPILERTSVLVLLATPEFSRINLLNNAG